MLDGLSQMQLAVTEQEHVALNAQRMLPSQEEIASLRLALAEFSLAIMEEHCAEEKRQALARERKTPAEVALQEFTRCTPEPDSVEQEWLTVGSTSGQLALGQLAAVRSLSPDSLESRARCLSLMGKYLRLLAEQEEPLYLCALWDSHTQKEARSDPKAVPAEDNSEEDGESSRRKQRVTPARSAELQQRRRRAQQLLAQASQALTEAVSLCLQHQLPPPSWLKPLSTCWSVMASLTLQRQDRPAVILTITNSSFITLLLFSQSCCTVASVAEVLGCACSGSGVSQFSALLNLHRMLLLSQEERPSMLKGVQDSLNSLSKAFSHLTIYPGHLHILAELPPNLKIVLLQHSEDGSELFGAFYEMNRAPNQKGKTTQGTGSLTCSKVAKVSVCPRALLALREQIRAFNQETRHALLKHACWHAAERRPQPSEEHRKAAAEEMLGPHFREIVENMDDYLNPLLTKFDFSCLRPQTTPLHVPEMTKARDKEEKGSPVKLPAESGEYVVLLADRKLLELPLEALSILQEESLNSVSRDFSLQLLHSRLIRVEPNKVESDNKKETKGGKGTKGKGDQSQAIKVILLTITMKAPLLKQEDEGDFGNPQPALYPSVGGLHGEHRNTQVEQLLCGCSAFIYLGMERFMANIPPAKLTALSLCECRLVLLFDVVQNNARQLDLEKPLHTALLLSLGGVGSIVLNQWHSSIQQNTHNLAHVLDNLLRVRQTSGQSIQALRRGDRSATPQHKVTGSYGTVFQTQNII
ncbi:hypothetical protein F7725_024444 [Dissostichus mawsoni]|uniref:Uncharacterized protein n=1 Tax=Dissostichus mawsoni TaxID=36200 RepID=A0A7J5Y0B5_DISMA|nr:hypothetical protein F7725_024444 [Dissostichus mawsoni]